MPPVIIAAAAAAAVSFGAYAVAATIVLSAGIVIYGTSQAKKAERQAREAAYAAMKDRMVTRIASESPYRSIYGRAKVGADIVAMFTTGDRDQFKHLVCVHAAHECDAIEAVYVKNVLVEGIDASGDATAGRFAVTPGTEVIEESKTGPSFTLAYTPKANSIWVFQGEGANMSAVTVTARSGPNITVDVSGPVRVSYERLVPRRFGEALNNVAPTSNPVVRVRKHLGGASDPVDAYLNSILPTKWPTTAVLRGMCYTVITLDLNHPEFQGGIVPIHALIRGKKVYDPRSGLTAWSQNPALIIRDYLTSPLCGVPATDLPASQFIAAANVCDEASPTGGVRYTINGTVTSDQSQSSVLESMVQAMAGGLVATTWDIYAGKYIAPVLALAQEDIVGDLSVTPGVSDASIYNGVKGQYLSPENKYVQTDFKPYQNSTYRVSDGRDLYTNIDFPFTDELQRVTNLARIFTEDHRNGFTVRADFSLKAWPVKVGQRVTLTSAFLGQTNKVYRVTDKSYAPNSAAVQLTLKEDDASIWDYADATTVDSTPNTDLPDPWAINPLTVINCSSGESTLLRQADGSTVPRILVTWPITYQQDGVQVEVEWRAVSSPTWEKTTVSASETQAYLSPITPGYFYMVRARCINLYLNVASGWTTNAYQVQVYSASPTVYMWAADKPALPSGAASYDWPTSTFGAAPAGWSLTVPTAPAGGNVSLWAASVNVTDISNVSTLFYWSGAEVSNIGYFPSSTGGAAGYSNARVFAWQRASTAPTLTPGAVNYDFTTGQITTATLLNGWLKTRPTANGNPLYVTSASASAAGTTDTIASNEWSAAVVEAIDGAAGLNNATITLYQRTASATAPALPSASVTYTFATGALTAPNNGWLTYIPNTGGQYLHRTQATAISASATDAIPASEWAAVQLMYDATDLIAAKAAADAANAKADAIAANGVLDRGEKVSLITEWGIIGGHLASNRGQADALGVSRTVYDDAHFALAQYLVSLSPAWDDITQDTNIVRDTYRAKFKAYYDAEVALVNAIAAKSATAPNLNIGIGRNMLANSAPGDKSSYTAATNTGFVINGPNLASPANGLSDFSRNGVSIWVNHSGTPANGTVTDVKANNEDYRRLPVRPNTRYEAAVDISAHRCNATVGVAWFNSTGGLIASYLGSTVPGGNPTYNLVPRAVLFLTSPSDAAYAVVFARMLCNGGTDPYIFASQWFFGEALTNQTVATQWSEGAPSSVRNIGYTGDLNATVGAPAGTNVGSTPATTVEANANNAVKPPTFTLTGTFGGTVNNSGTGTMTLGKTLTATVTGNVNPISITWDGTNLDSGVLFKMSTNTGTTTDITATGANMTVGVLVKCTATDTVTGVSIYRTGTVRLNFGSF